jgi:hypothetical protein
LEPLRATEIKPRANVLVSPGCEAGDWHCDGWPFSL